MANLYLIYQDENAGYDTYDSAVVVACSEEQARDMCPGSIPCAGWLNPPIYVDWNKPGSAWASRRESVRVKFLGVAADNLAIGAICASFEAG